MKFIQQTLDGKYIVPEFNLGSSVLPFDNLVGVLIHANYGRKGYLKYLKCIRDDICSYIVSQLGKAHPIKFHCGYRYCEKCSEKHSKIIFAKAMNRYTPLKFKNQVLYSSLLTLTLKPSGNLKSDFQDITMHWKDFKREVKRAGYNLGNGMMAFEIGRNKNVHLHAHMLNASYLPQYYISDLWQKITGDSPIVYITGKSAYTMKQKENLLSSGVGYVTKYITKSNQTIRDLNDLNFHQLFRGRPSYRWIGNMRIPQKPKWKCPQCKSSFLYFTSSSVEGRLLHGDLSTTTISLCISQPK